MSPDAFGLPDLGWRALTSRGQDGRTWGELSDAERDEVRSQTGVVDTFLEVIYWSKRAPSMPPPARAKVLR